MTGLSTYRGADNTFSNTADGYNAEYYLKELGAGVSGGGLGFTTEVGGPFIISYVPLNEAPTAYNGTTRLGPLAPEAIPEVTVSCFIPGTLISTPTGSTPVQDLAIGDLILTHLGQSVPVKWIGTQRFHLAFARDKLPICMQQGALGNGLPLRDLYVSPHHAMYVDDCLLIEAKALINGTTITQVTQWQGDVEYFHIETEHHEIILAEGAPAETFMDNVSRACFNNYSEYESLYPEEHEMIELDIPRVRYQRQLPNAVMARLEAISEGLMGKIKVQMKA